MNQNSKFIFKELEQNGFNSFIVGGTVRDLLLKKEPKDLDMCTSALPEDIERIFEKTIPVGKKFGVIIVVLNDEQIELTTMRSDGHSLDGRRPETVNFTDDPEIDSQRRDFTINGLYMTKDGKILDFHNGIKDLEERKITTIGRASDRFEEDYLRMLRAIRFATKLDFRISKEIFDSIQENLKKIKSISAERIREELTKILVSDNPGRGISIMKDTGFLELLLPEIHTLSKVIQVPKWHPEGDALTHTINVCSKVENDETLRWAAFLHDIGKHVAYEKGRIINTGDMVYHDTKSHEHLGMEVTEDILRNRLKFPNDFIENVLWICKNHMKFKIFMQMSRGKRRMMMQHPMFDNFVKLGIADDEIGRNFIETLDWIESNNVEEEVRPPRIVTGTDLLRLGFKQGRHLGNTLKEIQDFQLENPGCEFNDVLHIIEHNIYNKMVD